MRLLKVLVLFLILTACPVLQVYAAGKAQVLPGTFDGTVAGRSMPFYARGQTATFTFDKNFSAKDVPQGSKFLWTDAWGRVIKKVSLNTQGTAAVFKLSPVLTRKNYLVLADAEDKMVSSAPFLVVPDYRPFENYEVVIWGGFGGNGGDGGFGP